MQWGVPMIGAVVHEPGVRLDELRVEEKVERVSMDVTVGYGDVDSIQRMIQELELPILEEAFGEDVRYRLGIPVEDVESLRLRIGDLTRGAGRVAPA